MFTDTASVRSQNRTKHIHSLSSKCAVFTVATHGTHSNHWDSNRSPKTHSLMLRMHKFTSLADFFSVSEPNFLRVSCFPICTAIGPSSFYSLNTLYVEELTVCWTRYEGSSTLIFYNLKFIYKLRPVAHRIHVLLMKTNLLMLFRRPIPNYSENH